MPGLLPLNKYLFYACAAVSVALLLNTSLISQMKLLITSGRIII